MTEQDPIAKMVKELHRKTIKRMLEALDDPEAKLNAGMLREIRGLLKDNGVDDPMLEELRSGPDRSPKILPFTDPENTPLREEDLKNLG